MKFPPLLIAITALVSCAVCGHADEAKWNLVWQDDFERSEVGDEWVLLLWGKASIEKGRLLLQGYNATIITERTFKPDVRLKFEAEADPSVPPCDLSATIGANKSHGFTYLLAFGGMSNQINQILGPGVREVDRNPAFPIEHGKKYHIIAQKEGRRLSYTVDGVKILDAETTDLAGGPGFDRVGLITWTGMLVDNFKVYERATPHPDTPDYATSLPDPGLYRVGRKLALRGKASADREIVSAVDAFNAGDLQGALKRFGSASDRTLGLIGKAYVICDLAYEEKLEFRLDHRNEEFQQLADEFRAAAQADPTDKVLAAYSSAAKFLPDLIMVREGLTSAVRLTALGEKNNPFYHKARLYRARYHYWNGAEGGRVEMKEEACDWMAELKKTWPENTILRQYTGESVPWGEELDADTDEHPFWAAYLREAYARQIRIMERFFTKRQAPDGQLGGGYGDDVELMRTWMQIASISSASETVRAGIQCLAEGVWDNLLEDGYSRQCGDVEHAAEPSADMLPGMLLIRYGDPLWVERNLRSCKTIHDLFMGIDKKGYPRFKSTEFGTELVNTHPRAGGDTGYHARPMKHFIWQAWWGDREAKDWFVRWCDGWRATTVAQIDSKRPGLGPGTIWYPSGEIFPPADAPWYDHYWNYYSALGLGPTSGRKVYDSFLCAYYFTRDRKFLEPFQLLMDAATLGPPIAGKHSPPSKEWQLQAMAGLADGHKTSLYKWLTGERVYDEYTVRRGDAAQVYRANYDLDQYMKSFESAAKGQRNNLELQTTEVLSTDRASLVGALTVFGAYTGAISYLADAATPTFAVTYDTPDTNFAALVTESTPKRVRVWLYSFRDETTRIGLKLWQLVPGEYVLNQGEVLAADDPTRRSYAWIGPRTVKITHRAETVYVDVPPAKQWVVDLRLETPIDVPDTAPDLAINARDLKWTDRGLQLTVHNIGNADSASTVAVLQAKKGEDWATVGRADIPAIPAPRDFSASTEDVLISVRKAEVGNQYRLLVDPEDGQYEICEGNNQVTY